MSMADVPLSPIRLLIATDAWHPQVNGVVRSLEYMAQHAAENAAEVFFLTPQDFLSVPMPGYSEIRLSFALPGKVARAVKDFAATHVHIATEGPIGFMMRRHCLRHALSFTTSYHTKFPEYLAARLPVPEAWSYAALRGFHNAGSGIMVSTATLEADLHARGFKRLMRWSRGVDTALFRPDRGRMLNLPAPIMLYVGRVAVEKNLEAFLSLDLPGSKVIVGDGPARAGLEAQFPDAHFLGLHEGESLANLYASADVFVFPSRTDTFGIVLLEAMASGLPIAAYPVTGPLDVVGNHGIGALHDDLATAIRAALTISREACRNHAMRYSWAQSAQAFFSHVRAGVRATA
jgi:glycosyltransferase involved in cell wall biosynthesis